MTEKTILHLYVNRDIVNSAKAKGINLSNLFENVLKNILKAENEGLESTNDLNCMIKEQEASVGIEKAKLTELKNRQDEIITKRKKEAEKHVIKSIKFD